MHRDQTLTAQSRHLTNSNSTGNSRPISIIGWQSEPTHLAKCYVIINSRVQSSSLGMSATISSCSARFGNHGKLRGWFPKLWKLFCRGWLACTCLNLTHCYWFKWKIRRVILLIIIHALNIWSPIAGYRRFQPKHPPFNFSKYAHSSLKRAWNWRIAYF